MKELETAFDKSGNEFVAVKCANCDKLLPGQYQVFRLAPNDLVRWPTICAAIAAYGKKWFWYGGAIGLGAIYGVIAAYTVYQGVEYGWASIHIPDLSDWIGFAGASLFMFTATGSLMERSKRDRRAEIVLPQLGLPAWSYLLSDATIEPELLGSGRKYKRVTTLLLPKANPAA